MCIPNTSPNGQYIVSPAQAQHLRVEAFADGLLIVRRWLERRRQMRALANLDNRLLEDIGLTREVADREIAKALRRSFAPRHLK